MYLFFIPQNMKLVLLCLTFSWMFLSWIQLCISPRPQTRSCAGVLPSIPPKVCWVLNHNISECEFTHRLSPLGNNQVPKREGRRLETKHLGKKEEELVLEVIPSSKPAWAMWYPSNKVGNGKEKKTKRKEKKKRSGNEAIGVDLTATNLRLSKGQ